MQEAPVREARTYSHRPAAAVGGRLSRRQTCGDMPYRDETYAARCRVCGAETQLRCCSCDCSICAAHAREVPAGFFVPVYICVELATCVAPRHEARRYQADDEYMSPMGVRVKRGY